jgi:hypothetical protein
MSDKSFEYLALCPSKEWIKELSIDKALNKKTILVTSRIPLNKLETRELKEKFGLIKEVNNYEDDREILETVKSYYQEFHFKRIVAPDEDDILRAASLRKELKLEGQTYESALAFRDKIFMKEILKKKGIFVPSFEIVRDSKDLVAFLKANSYPLILKPCRATGCQGIYPLRDKKELPFALKLIDAAEPFSYQVERFIKGGLYHVDGLIEEGRLVCSWPSLYYHPPLNLLESKCASSYLLQASNPLTSSLNHYTQEILQHLPTPSHTAFHLEVFLEESSKTPIFCEIASRVGGKGVNHGWKSSFNIDLKRIFVLMQYGVTTPLTINFPVSFPISGEIWYPFLTGKVREVPLKCPFPWVKEFEITVKVGDTLEPSRNIQGILGGSPLLSADNEEEMQARMNLFTSWFYKSLKVS